MKKLVTAFALCAAISAMAVESQNVVGYQTINLPVGASVVTPTFVDVGGDETASKLGDIVPSASFDGANGDNIQFFNLDGSGSVTQTAEYWAGLGWFIFATETNIDDQPLTKGQGFLATASTASTLTFKGQVRQTSFNVSVPVGFSLVGNSVPKAITLGDVVPSASFDGANGDNLQFLNSDGSGSVVQTAEYWAGLGWFIFATETNIDAQPLPQGEAFLVTASSASNLSFPAAM